jgi:hypothetical protein
LILLEEGRHHAPFSASLLVWLLTLYVGYGLISFASRDNPSPTYLHLQPYVYSKVDPFAGSAVRMFQFVPIIPHIALPVIVLAIPDLNCICTDRLAVIFNYECNGKVMVLGVSRTLREYPSCSSHVTAESPNVLILLGILDRPGKTHRNRQTARNNGRGNKAIFWVTQRDRMASTNVRHHLFLRDSLEDCVVVAAPRRTYPVSWSDFREDVNQLIFVAAAKVDGSMDFAGIESISNALRKLLQVTARDSVSSYNLEHKKTTPNQNIPKRTVTDQTTPQQITKICPSCQIQLEDCLLGNPPYSPAFPLYCGRERS